MKNKENEKCKRNVSFWAAAPKGLLTYDSTQGNFLHLHVSIRLSVCPYRPLEPSWDPLELSSDFLRPTSDPPRPTSDPQGLPQTFRSPRGPSQTPVGPPQTLVCPPLQGWTKGGIKINKLTLEFVHTVLLNFQNQYNDCSSTFNALNTSGYIWYVENL